MKPGRPFIFSLLICPFISYQQEDDGYCSYISGQGCLNGICKFCAMCVSTSCILATPYSTGDNEISTCAATHQTEEGYDFYNYCLSSGTDDDGDPCNTSTQCYSYRQGNTTFAMHSWDNLTCDSADTCLLVNIDGTQPAAPIPLDNNTIITPISNSTNHHHPSPPGGGNRHHHNQFDLRSGSAASIALTTVCIVVSLCLIAWLIRILFYKSKYWPKISKYLCCGLCTYKPNNETTIDSASPNTAPPSFHSEMVMRSNSSSNHSSVLPDYFQQDASPPKYEQAIVTQIRGTRSYDHHPSTIVTNGDCSQQPIWVPVYLSPQQNSNNGRSSFSNFISSNNAQDWATQTMTHQPHNNRSSASSSTAEEEVLDITNIQRHHND